MCKICDPPRHHWSSDPHKFKSPPIPVSIEPAACPAGDAAFNDGNIFTVGDNPQRFVAVKPPFDRSAYQKGYMREYMRKRRAKAHLKSGGEPANGKR